MQDQSIPQTTKDTTSPFRVEVECGQCGVRCLKRRDHLRERNFCSRACYAEFRRVEGARWRDPEQISEYMREYVRRNREKHNARCLAWAKANREKCNENQRARRARGQGKGFMGRLRREMIAAYGSQCLACGTDKRVEIDHVVPVSQGGPSDVSNVQPLCRTCNASKSDRVIDYRWKRRHVEAQYGIEIVEIRK